MGRKPLMRRNIINNIPGQIKKLNSWIDCHFIVVANSQRAPAL
jgi:hypothetical protein